MPLSLARPLAYWMDVCRIAFLVGVCFSSCLVLAFVKGVVAGAPKGLLCCGRVYGGFVPGG